MTKCILEDFLEGIAGIGDDWSCLGSFQHQYGVQNVAKKVLKTVILLKQQVFAHQLTACHLLVQHRVAIFPSSITQVGKE